MGKDSVIYDIPGKLGPSCRPTSAPREQGTHPANAGLLACWGEYLAPVECEDDLQQEGSARQAS